MGNFDSIFAYSLAGGGSGTVTVPGGDGNNGLMKDLAANWSFDNAGNLGKDYSGNNNDLTVEGSPIAATGQAGGAVQTSVGNYFSRTNSTPFDTPRTQGFSFSAWYKIPTGAASAEQTVVAQYTDTPVDRAYRLVVTPTEAILYWVYNTIGGQVKAATHTTTIDTWYHIAVTHDPVAKKLQFYINAVKKEFTYPANALDATSEFSIGAHDNGNAGGDMLIIDDASYWAARVLTELDIVTLYNGGTPLTISDY